MAHDYKDISSICNFKNANKTLRFDNTMQAKQECPCHELWSIETSLLTLGSDTRREYTHAPILAIPFQEDPSRRVSLLSEGLVESSQQHESL